MTKRVILYRDNETPLFSRAPNYIVGEDSYDLGRKVETGEDVSVRVTGSEYIGEKQRAELRGVLEMLTEAYKGISVHGSDEAGVKDIIGEIFLDRETKRAA